MTPIGHTAAPYVHIVMDDGLAHEIGAPEHAGPRRSEDNAASQVLTPDDGYGSRPRCEKCGRGFYVCICNVPEPEPEYFKPAVRHDPDGWNRVEF